MIGNVFRACALKYNHIDIVRNYCAYTKSIFNSKLKCLYDTINNQSVTFDKSLTVSLRILTYCPSEDRKLNASTFAGYPIAGSVSDEWPLLTVET